MNLCPTRVVKLPPNMKPGHHVICPTCKNVTTVLMAPIKKLTGWHRLVWHEGGIKEHVDYNQPTP